MDRYFIGIIIGIPIGFALGIFIIWSILPDRKDKNETNNP